MRVALVIAACLFATPLAAQQQIACVPDVAAADEAARNAGEELALELETVGGTPLRLFVSRHTWSVWFERNGRWCTAPSMMGAIKRPDQA
jgi:hypothetical protein